MGRKLRIIGAVCLIIVICFMTINTKTGEMYDTTMQPLIEKGDSILMLRSGSWIDYRINDVIEFRTNNFPSIKKIAAVGGQQVEIRDNKLYVEGKENSNGNCSVPCPDQVYQLQEGEYFVIGNNSSVSYDSRYYGPITQGEIRYRVILNGF